MKKTYIAPEMEILDTELEGVILTASEKTDPGSGNPDDFARQGSADFEEDDEDF